MFWFCYFISYYWSLFFFFTGPKLYICDQGVGWGKGWAQQLDLEVSFLRGNTLRKHFVCISTSSNLLWGLSVRSHEPWQWMALCWPRSSSGVGAQTHKRLFLHCGSACARKPNPTRLLTCLNFRADSGRAAWRLIWLLWRAASSVCAELPRHWHTPAHRDRNPNTHKPSSSSQALWGLFGGTERTHSDNVSNLPIGTCDYTDNGAKRIQRGEARGRKWPLTRNGYRQGC